MKAKGIAAYLRLNAKTAGCVVEDISAGGLLLRTDRVVPVGTTISLDLVDPEAKRAVTLSGQVVGIILKEAAARRGEAPGLRIRFNRQAGATHEYLQKLMARLGAPQGDAPVFYAVTRPPPRARREREPERPDEPPVLFPVERTRQGAGEDGGSAQDEWGADEAVEETHVPRGAHVAAARPEDFEQGGDYDGPGAEERTLLYEPGEEEGGEPEEEEGEDWEGEPVPQDEPAGDGDRTAAHKAEVAALRLRVAELEAEIGRLSSALEQQMAQSEERVRELRGAITERDRKISRLREEANELRVQLAGGDSLTPIRPAPRRY